MNVNLCSVGFWSQQELSGSKRLWLCNYRPPKVNYSYLCLVPPIWTTQAARRLSSFSPSSQNPWSGLNHATLSSTATLSTLHLSIAHLSPQKRSRPFTNIFSISLNLHFSFPFSTLFCLVLPNPLPLPALLTALKRQFSEDFPTLKKKHCLLGGFNTQCDGYFHSASNFITWNISPCVWQHDSMTNEVDFF